MSTPAAEVDVDSTDREEFDEQPATRRRIEAPTLGTGERRRTVTVAMGGWEYEARCPKLVVWNDMASIITEQHTRNRADRRRAGDTTPAESARVTTDRIRLTNGLSHFLRGCLTRADWSAIEVDLNDPDVDLDIPDMWAAGIHLVIEFKPDMQQMAERIGMKMPGVLDKLADRIDPETGELKPETVAEKPKTARSRPRAGNGKRGR